MIISSIPKTKINLEKLIEEVLKGEEVVITKYGNQIAKLVIYRK